MGAPHAADGQHAAAGPEVTDGRVLHTGALRAFARGSLYMAALLRRAVDGGVILAVPSGALAEAWATAGEGRYRLDLLTSLPVVTVVAMGESAARAVGEILAATHETDIVAGHAAYLSAEQGWPIVTNDAKRLRAVHPAADIDEIP